jgi:ribose transport system substrate-binding protein
MRWLKKGLAIGACAGITCGVAACGSASSSSSSSSSGGTATSASSSQPAASANAAGVAAAQAQIAQYTAAPTSIGTYPTLKTAPPKGKTVVYLGTSEVSNTQVAAQIKQVTTLAGWKYYSVSYDPSNPATFIAAFNTAIAKGANYVMESDTALPPQVLSAAAAHHIKLSVDNVIPQATNSTVIQISAGYAPLYLMGQLTADEFIADSSGKGKAVAQEMPQYPSLNPFIDGLQATLKKDCSACQTSTVNVTIPQWTGGHLDSLVISAVKSHPGYNYLITSNGPFFDGIQSALSAAGITGEKILGQVGDAQGFAAVKAGTELAWTGFSQPFDAYEMMDAVFRDSEGMAIPKADTSQPVQLVTHANAGSIKLYPNLGGYTYPITALQQFETVWHLS